MIHVDVNKAKLKVTETIDYIFTLSAAVLICFDINESELTYLINKAQPQIAHIHVETMIEAL